jgi:hypothetical protein
MTKATVATSLKADIAKATQEVVATATAGMIGQQPILCIVYAGVAHDQVRLIESLCAALPGVPMVGASSQGVSVSETTFEADRFVGIALLYSDTVRVTVASVPSIAHDAYASGLALAKGLGKAQSESSTTLLWYDPLGGVNAEDVLRGMKDGGHNTVYGGASGQPWGRMVRTFQYADSAVFTDGAVAVLIDGLIPVAELTHGAEAIGLSLRATRTDGNAVLELNGRPALDVWCEQLGVSAEREVENSANWALGVRPPENGPYEGLITRAPMTLDHARKALIFQAHIPEGSDVQVCIRTQSAVLGGANAMGTRLAAALVGKRDILALGFECGARPAPFLGRELAAIEISDIQGKLRRSLPWLGMYAWGEIAPVAGVSEFHNFTFPLCVLCEPNAAS